MIEVLKESDIPKGWSQWLSQFLARPPQPILRFRDEPWWEGDTLHFRVRNGLPLPLLYSVYVEADGDYAERPDHIGPFSSDRWRLTFDRRPSKINIRLGLVPFEIMTDRRIMT